MKLCFLVESANVNWLDLARVINELNAAGYDGTLVIDSLSTMASDMMHQQIQECLASLDKFRAVVRASKGPGNFQRAPETLEPLVCRQVAPPSYHRRVMRCNRKGIGLRIRGNQ